MPFYDVAGTTERNKQMRERLRQALKPKADPKIPRQRFVETALMFECDQDEEKFETTLSNITEAGTVPTSQNRRPAGR